MTKHLIDTQFSAYIDNEMSSEERTRFASHLNSCADCSVELEHLQEVKIRLNRIPKEPAPAELLSRLRKKYDPTPWWPFAVPSWLSSGNMFRPALAFAAALVVSVVFVVNRPQKEDEYVDLDSLLVAHAKYQGESLMPQADMSQSNYSARLASFYQDEN